MHIYNYIYIYIYTYILYIYIYNKYNYDNLVLQNDISQYSNKEGKYVGGKLLQYIKKNETCSLHYCKSIIQQSKEFKLDPLLKNLCVDSDIQEIIGVIKDIQTELLERGKGPAKDKVQQEFIEVKLLS